MKKNFLKLFFLLFLIFPQESCKHKPKEKHSNYDGIIIKVEIGKNTFENIPINIFFAPKSPFIRIPLFILETKENSYPKIKARIPLKGIKNINDLSGEKLKVGSNLFIKTNKNKNEITIIDIGLFIEFIDNKDSLKRIKCVFTGEGSIEGDIIPIYILAEGPLLILDGRFHYIDEAK